MMYSKPRSLVQKVFLLQEIGVPTAVTCYSFDEDWELESSSRKLQLLYPFMILEKFSMTSFPVGMEANEIQWEQMNDADTDSVSHSDVNGKFTEEPFEIDKKLLIDPGLLFVGPKIGEGAHGKVYKGRYRPHGDQFVAIKVLNGGRSPEEKAKLEGRFAREINMMTKVKHENLVKFIGACKDPFMVIVTELLPGTSLRKYLTSARPRRLDLRVAVNYALNIARAMECLHANGIIHRDLKPDNLLLTEDQKSVKLIDFGLAREESLTEMMTAETGTYRWMAPELYSTVTLRRGEKKHYTNKVDVYSFGIVLWELLTNRMPFDGMSNLQAAYAAAFKQARPEISDEMPAVLASLMQSCWVEDPILRPSFVQIIHTLSEFLVTLAPPPPSPEPDPSEPSPSFRETTISSSPTRAGGKLSFLKQMFTTKKTGSKP